MAYPLHSAAAWLDTDTRHRATVAALHAGGVASCTWSYTYVVWMRGRYGAVSAAPQYHIEDNRDLHSVPLP